MMNTLYPLFSFGTLRDLDVLAIVTDQPTGLHLKPAYVRDRALHQVEGEDFPVMVTSKGGRVDGVLIEGLTDKAFDRVVFFEGEEYVLDIVDVSIDDGSQVRAHYFKEASVYTIRATGWEYQQWNSHEKAEFLDRTARYMKWYGMVSVSEADQYW